MKVDYNNVKTFSSKKSLKSYSVLLNISPFTFVEDTSSTCGDLHSPSP